MNGRKAIDQLLTIARDELMKNTSITVYSMRDGHEYGRRHANPLAQLGLMVDEAAQAFRRFGEATSSLFDRYVAELNAWAALAPKDNLTQ